MVDGMMKIRAWDDVLGEMLYSRIEQFDDSLMFRFEKHFETDEPKYMRSTGLYDRNGKEIYEGDVLKTDLSRPFLVVVYRNGAFMFQCHDNGKDYFDLMVPIDQTTDSIDLLEVIGNIYEHQYLLEGDENDEKARS